MEELFDKIINRSLKKKATDIHFVLKEKLVIRMRILGDLVYYDMMNKEEGQKLMNFMKYQAKINTNYRLQPQTGQFVVIQNQKEYFLRVSYLPSLEFESIVVRVLNNHDSLSIEELTPLETIIQNLQKIPFYTSGLFLISGATGSGKSTTLYTLLDAIVKTKRKNVITIEDPIEMRKEECLQIELNEKLGITYEHTLKQILRHDPDVIMIGEIRDEQTAKIAITCALTGHLVLTTIHASSAYLALKRLENLGISKIDLCDVIIGSLSQKMKFDKKSKKVILLPELITKEQINNALNKNQLNYQTFNKNRLELIQKHHIPEYVFEGDIYE